MRLPWVSRRSLESSDATVASLTEQLRLLQAYCSAADKAYAMLEASSSQTHLALDAAERALDDARDKQTEQKKVSKLTQAIRSNARGPDGRIDRRLLGYFRNRANDLRAQGLSTDEITEEIGTWQTTETTDAMTPERMAALHETDKTDEARV